MLNLRWQKQDIKNPPELLARVDQKNSSSLGITEGWSRPTAGDPWFLVLNLKLLAARLMHQQ